MAMDDRDESVQQASDPYMMEKTNTQSSVATEQYQASNDREQNSQESSGPYIVVEEEHEREFITEASRTQDRSDNRDHYQMMQDHQPSGNNSQNPHQGRGHAEQYMMSDIGPG